MRGAYTVYAAWDDQQSLALCAISHVCVTGCQDVGVCDRACVCSTDTKTPTLPSLQEVALKYISLYLVLIGLLCHLVSLCYGCAKVDVRRHITTMYVVLM